MASERLPKQSMMAVSSFTLASTMISKSAFAQSPIPSPKTQAILDGEICALDEHGFPRFEWLVNRGRVIDWRRKRVLESVGGRAANPRLAQLGAVVYASDPDAQLIRRAHGLRVDLRPPPCIAALALCRLSAIVCWGLCAKGLIGRQITPSRRSSSKDCSKQKGAPF